MKLHLTAKVEDIAKKCPDIVTLLLSAPAKTTADQG